MIDYTRQQGILDPRRFAWPVHLVGLGGIGSAVAPILAKLGVSEIHLWDDDTLENGNLPSQFLYRLEDVGKTKVEAAREILSALGPVAVTAHARRFTTEETLEGIVVSGVDSMASRAAIWERVRFNIAVPLFFDGRLGGEILELHTVRPVVFEEVQRYDGTLFPDDEAAPLPCTERAIIHPAVVLAGLVASQLTRWMREEPYPQRILFDLKTLQLHASPLITPKNRQTERR